MTPPPVEVQGAILGVVQGLTEFLPISSSAHLVALPQLLGWPYLGKTFDVSLHLGTLIALGVHYRAEVQELGLAFARLVFRCGKPQGEWERICVLLAVASVPAAIGGYLLDGLVERYLQGLALVATVSLVWGALLAWADRRASNLRVRELTWPEAAVIGFAQMAALLPGTSRSGATLTAGTALGLSRAEAARFSMLCSLPLVAGAVLYKGLGLIAERPDPQMLRAMLLGTLASAWVGRLCLRGLLRYLQSGSLQLFALYRWAFGLGLLLWLSGHGQH